MTEPIQVIPIGEPELPPETVTERALEEIIQGSRVIHARHQGFTKAMARKLLAVMQENAKLREALNKIWEVASGESQVAMDDTAGMEWVSDYASTVWDELEEANEKGQAQ
jgi:hypothetical protein